MKRNLIVILTILACSLVACKPGQKKLLPVTQSDSCGWFFWFC